MTRTSLHHTNKLVILTILLAGCDDEPLQRVVSPQADAPPTNVQMLLAGRPIEQEFGFLAAQIPGFAGFHLDTSGAALVVRTTRGSLTATELQLVRDRVANGLPSSRQARAGAAQISVQNARFDFVLLRQWRDVMSDSAQQPAYAITYLDLDEVANRIAVGVEFGSAVSLVSSLASRLGIPAEAISVQIAPAAQPIQDVYLNDRVRPLQGGTQVRAEPISQTGRCTLTIPAYYPARAQNVIITASHCSNIKWGPDNGDGGRIQQPTSVVPPPAGWNFFGGEIHDEAGWSRWTGVIHGSCRQAEPSAYSLANLEFVSGDSVSFRLGRIARPYLAR
ncbi:MAG: hypothetical protein ACT4P6_13095, partial [Gemmatimonadaceae bacterium]